MCRNHLFERFLDVKNDFPYVISTGRWCWNQCRNGCRNLRFRKENCKTRCTKRGAVGTVLSERASELASEAGVGTRVGAGGRPPECRNSTILPRRDLGTDVKTTGRICGPTRRNGSAPRVLILGRFTARRVGTVQRLRKLT